MFATHTHQHASGVEASRSEACPLCGHERYCFLIKDDNSETFKVLCQWTNSLEGWQRTGTSKDGRGVFLKEGYSQRRERDKRYPEVIKLKSQAKTEIPQWQDIHIPVEQAERGHSVLIKQELNLGNPETIYEIKELRTGKRQGKNTLLAILTVKGSSYGGTIEIAATDIAEVLTHDPATGAKEEFIKYAYSDDLKVVRRQWTDRRAVYNGKTKQVRPYHRGTDGSWILGKGNRQWPLYQQLEAEATIRAGGIVFAVGGEQAVEYLRSLGLTAVCNQGGESSCRQIASDLAPAFAEAVENDLKPLLISWADNDEAGFKNFGEGLLKECYKRRVTCVAIDPLALWLDMPPSGDAKDWIDHCQESDISEEEMIRALEFAVDSAIDCQEEENRLRWQREAWKSPVSHKGEIGSWIVSGEGKDLKKEWKPLCNFDFQVERELEDASGGGLVLQVKRSFEPRQYRVILNSTDYTTPDKFVDALKTALGTGIVCNLKKDQLGAVIHTRVHEYRTNRQGKVYKRIDRYGQQEDGTWVFGDRQYTPDGKPTSENETGWVFNPALGKDDYIPCPKLAPEDPKALKRLVDAARQFYGSENLYQVLLTMGWVTAGLHSQTIFKQENSIALLNSHGEPGSCKTLAAETALSLVGTNWPEMGMLARASVSALYEHGSRTGSIPFVWDDPERRPENEELTKTWFNWKPRRVRGNEQTPKSPMGVTSNHVFGGDQSAAYTRFVRLPFKRAAGGSKNAFQALKNAQRLASGAFPTLIQLGYPRDAIAELERDLLTHLPLAHARIAQSLAIVTYYAQKLVELTGGIENIKEWVIKNLCHAENDAENSADSLQDFIAKILSLEGQNLVGDWNKQPISTKDGQEWIAIHCEDVWALVDRQFRPAAYNKKSLKSLVLAAGGKTDSVQRFAVSKDEVLTYYAAKINPRTDRDGNEIPPNQPRTVTRKSWLLPMSLFNSDDSGSPPNPSTVIENVENKTLVTACYRLLPKTVTAQNPCEWEDLKVFPDPVTTVTKKVDQIKIKESQETAGTENSIRINSVTNSGNSGNTVTVKTETPVLTEFQLVTELPSLSVTESVTEELEPQPYQHPTSMPDEPFQVGDRVFWDECPGACAWGNPFTITAIEGDCVMLDLIANPVLLSELRRSP